MLDVSRTTVNNDDVVSEEENQEDVIDNSHDVTIDVNSTQSDNIELDDINETVQPKRSTRVRKAPDRYGTCVMAQLDPSINDLFEVINWILNMPINLG